MCGLAGMIRTKWDDYRNVDKMERVMTNILVTSQLRGFDSSGIAALVRRLSNKPNKYKHQYNWLMDKGLYDPFFCLSNIKHKKRTRKYKNPKRYSVPYIYSVLGHARHATKGEVSADNAHPFSFDNNRFIGVHNGTITNSKQVLRALQDETPLEGTLPTSEDYLANDTDFTDSEIVLYCVYRWGIEKVYEHISGAWALIFYRESDQTISFIRNSQRTLHYYQCPQTECIYWSSEEKMLRFAIERELKLHGAIKIEKFKEHNLYVHDLNSSFALFCNKEFPWKEVADLSAKQYSGYGSAHRFCESYYGGVDYGYNRRSNYEVWKPKIAAKPTPKVIEYKKKEEPKVVAPPTMRAILPPEQAEVEGMEAWISKHYPDAEELDIRNTYCLHCLEDIAPNDSDVLPVKGHGLVCSTCTSSLEAVEQITIDYEEAAEDHEWVQLYLDLSEEKKLQEIRNGIG